MSLAILIGDRQHGKTTTCRTLTEEARRGGYGVAGILAPAVYQQDQLMGYDVVDLVTEASTRLARIDAEGSESVGRFHFLDEGLAFGRTALQSAAKLERGLVIVDEVGPLELSGGGWQACLDSLVKRNGLTMFTVRRSLADDVARLWTIKLEYRFDLNDGTAKIVERVLQLIES